MKDVMLQTAKILLLGLFVILVWGIFHGSRRRVDFAVLRSEVQEVFGTSGMKEGDAQLLRRLVRNIVMGLWVMALLISSSIICTTDMTPKIFGIPALGAFGYILAFVIVMYVFIKHMLSRK